MEGHTKKMFLKITGFSKKDLKGKLVLDFGCGSGRFIDIVREMGGIAVGIDMSAAVEPARENFKNDTNVLIVQGDILHPPFRKSIFEVGYTIGVLHHTPNPGKGLKNLSYTIKKGGLIACSVYGKGGFYAYPSTYLYRKIHKHISFLFGNRPAIFYSYFSAYFIYYALNILKKLPLRHPLAHLIRKYVFVTVYIPDAKWRTLDIFDAITPSYASTHTGKEIAQWFKDARIRNLTQTKWSSTSFRGRKM